MTDPRIAKRNRANKARGAKAEIDVENFFRGKYYDAQRLPKRGVNDEGDVMVSLRNRPRESLVIEVKDWATINLAGWWDEAVREAKKWMKARPGATGWPILVIKRRQRNISQAWVVMSLETFEEFIR